MYSNIKFFCSCIRNIDKLLDECKENLESKNLSNINENPKSGDIIIVKVLDDTCGYSAVENTYGRLVTINKDDIFVAVLGNRKSGTSLYGEIPNIVLNSGDYLDLLSQGGIVGKCICVDNTHRNKKALPLKIEGFLLNKKSEIANVSDFNTLNINKIERNNKSIKSIFVMGTSAEVGKTTMLCNLVKSAKSEKKDIKIACIKICGTGRLRDKLNYKDVGCNISFDFVDAGYVSTYGIDRDEYNEMLYRLYDCCKNFVDLIIFEVGGDLFEGNADLAIEFSNKLEAIRVLVVNDAMGAICGMNILDYNNTKDRTYIASWKQNNIALQNRLGIYKTFNTSDILDVSLILKRGVFNDT